MTTQHWSDPETLAARWYSHTAGRPGWGQWHAVEWHRGELVTLCWHVVPSDAVTRPRANGGVTCRTCLSRLARDDQRERGFSVYHTRQHLDAREAERGPRTAEREALAQAMADWEARGGRVTRLPEGKAEGAHGDGFLLTVHGHTVLDDGSPAIGMEHGRRSRLRRG